MKPTTDNWQPTTDNRYDNWLPTTDNNMIRACIEAADQSGR
ncbi:MAG: hypothetical protein SF339_29885 [Blastocatellia bacterium]|nr:hypothetical protein [Blastocatellia bacterium]